MDNQATTNGDSMENIKVTFSFYADDAEAVEMLCSQFEVDEDDFWKKESFDGSKIKKVFTVLYKLIKDPDLIKNFMTAEGREVTFDNKGNLLNAKGYSASEIHELFMTKNKLY